VNEGGMTPREVSSLFNEELHFSAKEGTSEKVSLFGRPSFGRLRGLVVPARLYGMTSSQEVRTEAKILPFIVVAHAH